jgi:hypothetical protein
MAQMEQYGLMAWEWVAPIAGAVATVSVGVAGIVATYKAGSRQQNTALEVVRQQAEAQIAVAREERQQRRLEEAYLEMLAAITSIHYWVFTVYPALTNTLDQFTMPPLPDLPDNARKEALWTAYWSPRVEQLMEDWEAAVRRLQSTVIDADRSVRQQVRLELLGQHDGHAEEAAVKPSPPS